MIYIKTKHQIDTKWFAEDGFYAKGFAFVGNKLIMNNSIKFLIFRDDFRSDWPVSITKLNGVFSLIYHEGDHLWACIDRSRGIPLFYGTKDADFFISDDAYWVCEKVGDKEMDELSVAEFLLSGYVTGEDTLYPNVKQLQAGQTLAVNNSDKNIEIKKEHYYKFIHHDYFEESEQQLLEGLDKAFLNSIKRMIDFADGRTLVIPLSGGYDSRLISTTLKRLNYENVICYTYGKPENTEIKISKSVAQALGYKHLFIPYSKQKWHNWFHSEERHKFYRYSDGLSVLAHIQDWPAVWEINRQKLVPADSIFAPGYPSGLMTGQHTPKAFFEKKDITQNDVIDKINNIHLRLQNRSCFCEEILNNINIKTINLISSVPILNSDDAANAFEMWEWQERQAKYLTNSSRAYELYGYQWYMPFWDVDFMGFCERLPPKYRFGRKLYIKYVNQITNDWNLPVSGSETGSYRAFWLLRKVITFLGLKKLGKQVFLKKSYWEHPFEWYGIMSEAEFKKYFSANVGLPSYLVRERLGRMINSDVSKSKI